MCCSKVYIFAKGTIMWQVHTVHLIQIWHYFCIDYCCVCILRKGQLSHPLPDFSKVEPRVHFPKNSGYRPPKSRRPPHDSTSHPDLPVVFKSPAEIVREVLLSSSDGSPGNPSTNGTHKRLHSKVPEEFRCPQQASTLVQQLQVIKEEWTHCSERNSSILHTV